MAENRYQRQLKDTIKRRFPGCVILKNDPTMCQGIPDLIVLHGDKWAMLEVKKCEGAKKQPNQEYYVDKFKEMSYAAFISPDNEEDVLNELECAFKPSR